MRVVWTNRAFSQLRGLQSWLNSLENANVARVMRRIQVSCDRLERLGDIGRPGQAAGTRELSVRLAPYVLVYSVRENEALILGIYHMAQGARE
jgi:toxin ParE1/3/4